MLSLQTHCAEHLFDSVKIKQSTLTLAEKDNLDHLLLNHTNPAA